MPLISDRWTSHFRWRGRGVMPAEERQKLRAIVRKCHSAGRRVRFWATPELPAVWEELLAAGVDYINTDRLEEMREFLLHRSSTANDAAPLENAD
jgi:glycerophosphoryl diester phosphodiesterase